MKQSSLAQRTIQAIEAELQLTYTTAVIDGAALRGELGREAQDRALAQWQARHQALKAEGKVDEARELRAFILRVVPLEGGAASS